MDDIKVGQRVLIKVSAKRRAAEGIPANAPAEVISISHGHIDPKTKKEIRPPIYNVQIIGTGQKFGLLSSEIRIMGDATQEKAETDMT